MAGPKIIALVLILSGLTLIVGFFIVRHFQSRTPNAGLKVDTSPSSLVFVNNNQIGKTPLEKHFRAGEIAVKLIPESTSSSLPTYQTKIHLTPGVISLLRYDFGSTEANSAGDTLSLQLQSDKTTSLAVISTPDSASVIVDGLPQGLTPLLISPLPAGSHTATVSAPGFISRSISFSTPSGYKSVLNVQLAVDIPFPPVLPASPSATSLPASSSQVTILDTPTGFLRVRSGPGQSFSEIGRVKPGEKYDLLATVSDWYQIAVKLESTSSGWISSRFAQKN